MKKSILASAVASLVLGTTLNAQVTSPTNVSTPPPQFVGFNGVGVPEELQIRNDFNLPISLWTNSVQRIHINQNIPGAVGFVGIGANFTNPQQLFHVSGGNIAIDNGFFITNAGTGTQDRLQFNTAQFRIFMRNKRFADFCELFGPLADEITFGDASDVNTKLLFKLVV